MANDGDEVLGALSSLGQDAASIREAGVGDGGGGIADIIGQQIDGVSDLQYEAYDESVTAEALMDAGSVEPPPAMPCNEETMICLRGPCVHRWGMLVRLEAQSEVVSIQRTQACARHERLYSLQDENTFTCSDWWPRTLLFVPAGLRPFLRPYLERLWERRLRAAGATFSWRWWPKNVFELPSHKVKELRDAARAKREAEKTAADAAASPLDEGLDL